jgi:hypothetical protein
VRISGATWPFQVYDFLQHLINWSAIFSPGWTRSHMLTVPVTRTDARCEDRMKKRLLSRIVLLVLSCSTLSIAAPVSVALLTLNDVGSAHEDPLDDFVEFRILNWNGFAFGNFATPITFSSVTLDLMWEGGMAPPGIIGPLDWYVNDPGHLNAIQPRDLAPNLSAYESTRFTKRYGIVGGTLTMQFTPQTAWSLQGGGAYTPVSYSYELMFTISPAAPQTLSVSARSTPPWWNIQVSDIEGGSEIPEPATYLMGGLGAVAMIALRRTQAKKRSS